MVAENSLSKVDNSAANRIEEVLLIHGAPRGERLVTEADFKTDHYFAPGVYIRSLFRRKGVKVVGHAHKHAHLSIVLTGCLRVFANGQHRDIRGGSPPFLTPAGTRKATMALRNTTLLTVHATNETDLQKLEDELIEKSQIFLAFEAAGKSPQLK